MAGALSIDMQTHKLRLGRHGDSKLTTLTGAWPGWSKWTALPPHGGTQESTETLTLDHND